MLYSKNMKNANETLASLLEALTDAREAADDFRRTGNAFLADDADRFAASVQVELAKLAKLAN